MFSYDIQFQINYSFMIHSSCHNNKNNGLCLLGLTWSSRGHDPQQQCEVGLHPGSTPNLQFEGCCLSVLHNPFLLIYVLEKEKRALPQQLCCHSFPYWTSLFWLVRAALLVKMSLNTVHYDSATVHCCVKVSFTDTEIRKQANLLKHFLVTRK